MSPAFALCLWTMIVALGLISALRSVDRLRSRGASRDILIAVRGLGHVPQARLFVRGKTPRPLERSDRPSPGRLSGSLNLGVFPHPTPRRAMRG